MCKSLYPDLQEEIERKFNNKSKHYQILVQFYESFGKIREALKILQEIGTNPAIVD